MFFCRKSMQLKPTVKKKFKLCCLEWPHRWQSRSPPLHLTNNCLFDSYYWLKKLVSKWSWGRLARPEAAGMFIPDPGSEFFHPGSRISGQKDPGSASKNLNIFNAKNCFYALGKMIWDDNPGSGFFSHSRSLIHRPKKHRIPDPQHWLEVTWLDRT